VPSGIQAKAYDMIQEKRKEIIDKINARQKNTSISICARLYLGEFGIDFYTLWEFSSDKYQMVATRNNFILIIITKSTATARLYTKFAIASH
jgi:hypothetical protein